MGTVTQRALIKLGHQYARLRASHVQHCQQIFCLLAHALFLWGWAAARAFAFATFVASCCCGTGAASGTCAGWFVSAVFDIFSTTCLSYRWSTETILGDCYFHSARCSLYSFQRFRKLS